MIRPPSFTGPVGRKPKKGRVVTADSDIATSMQSSELLAVIKDAGADRALFETDQAGILVSNLDEVSDIKHGDIIGILTAEVNGFLTDGIIDRQRSKYRLMISDILERIQSRLTAVGLDPAVASARAGLSKDAIRNIQRAVKDGKEGAGVSSTTLLKLAPVLQTTASWLLEGVGCGTENLPPSVSRLWAALTLAYDAPPEVQARIADFAEYQLANYSKSLETATNPDA